MTGALVFALMIQAGPDMFGLTARYVLIAAGPMVAGAAVIGLPLLSFANRRHLEWAQLLLLLFAAGFVLILIGAGIAAAFGVLFGLALLAFGVPTIWTVAGFALGVGWFSTRPRVSTAILAVCGAVCLSGVLTVVVPS